jgi:ferredoxin/flavodoxin---NADP+ reductase
VTLAIEPLAATPALKVAVVGAGPGGFYTTAALLKQHPQTTVSLIERLPAPYGLVRYGVAPDHPSLKSVENLFERTGRNPRVTFFGNTRLWRDTGIEELMASHDAVILAIGAAEDRALDLLDGNAELLYRASQIVGYYNSHPDNAHFTPDFGAGRVGIFGHGNVAADIARILLSPTEQLASTDISERCLLALRAQPIREVHLIGRRGPAETRFTAPVVTELLRLPDVQSHIDLGDPPLQEAAAGAIAPTLAACEVAQIFERQAQRATASGTRRLYLHFWSTPQAIRRQDGALQVTLTRQSGSSAAPRTLKLDAAISAIGFQLTDAHCEAVTLAGGAMPHRSGRVLDASGVIVPRLYAVGWAARGATGTIGTCRSDAERLVQGLVADRGMLPQHMRGGSEALKSALAARGHAQVNFQQWLRLDELERADGAALGRPRVKLPTMSQMLSSLSASKKLDRIDSVIGSA